MLRKYTDKFLLATVFVSGMSIMAVEMSASRLLAPYFGTSLFVWTNIIGIIMIALSIGYYLGGKIADKYHSKPLFYKIIIGGGFFIALIPFISKPIMSVSVKAITQESLSLFYTSLISTIILFALPLILLGMVSPYAIRLASKEIKTVGNIAGSIYALSTVGSIIGTFIPALLTIPFIGTKKTIILFAFILVLFSIIGLSKKKLFFIPLMILILLISGGQIKPTHGLIYEDESVYNYIQVIEENNIRYLKLNEGHATHSKYNPDFVLVNGVWDYFNIVPLVHGNAKDVLIIGIAAGTISKEYNYIFPEIKVDGVEIDGEVIEVGKTFFDMNDDNLQVYNMDGRVFLRATEKKYDVIITDAYKQPYIPFHLTTKEYFTEVKNHLNRDGIAAINVGSARKDSEILRMISNTMKSVYGHVYMLEVRNSLNYILLASDNELDINGIENNNRILNDLIDHVKENNEEIVFDENVLVLTDDKAPVEIYTDKMIYEYTGW